MPLNEQQYTLNIQDSDQTNSHDYYNDQMLNIISSMIKFDENLKLKLHLNLELN